MNKQTSQSQIILNYFAAHKLPPCVAEYRFHPVRRWRFDFVFLDYKLAIEQNGGAWINGRHNRGAGYLADMEKLNAAACLGYHVLQFTPQQIKTIEAINVIKAVLEQKKLQTPSNADKLISDSRVSTRLTAIDEIERQAKRLAKTVETFKTTGKI